MGRPWFAVATVYWQLTPVTLFQRQSGSNMRYARRYVGRTGPDAVHVQRSLAGTGGFKKEL